MPPFYTDSKKLNIFVHVNVFNVESLVCKQKANIFLRLQDSLFSFQKNPKNLDLSYKIFETV